MYTDRDNYRDRHSNSSNISRLLVYNRVDISQVGYVTLVYKSHLICAVIYKINKI